MPEYYWDPANLLQITLDADDEDREPQCVGEARSRRSKRCRLAIEDSDWSEARHLLLQMSRMMPKNVTNDLLHSLAYHCLCADYHMHQIEEVVSRWVRVIKRAARHHDNLLSRSPDSIWASFESYMEKKQLRNEVTAWRAEYEKSQDEKASQEIVISNLRQSKKDIEDKFSSILMEDAMMSTDFEETRRLLQASTTENKKTLRKNKGLKSDIATLRKEQNSLSEAYEKLQVQHGLVEKAKLQLKLDLDTSNGLLRQAQTGLDHEKSRTIALEKQITNLKMSVANHERSIDTSNGLLRQAQTDLDHKKSRTIALEKQITNLNMSVENNERSISECWLHGVFIWIAGFWKQDIDLSVWLLLLCAATGSG